MRLDSYFSNTLDELFLGEIATAKFVASIINISKWQIHVLCELLNYILTGIVQYGNDGFRTESMQYDTLTSLHFCYYSEPWDLLMNNCDEEKPLLCV